MRSFRPVAVVLDRRSHRFGLTKCSYLSKHLYKRYDLQVFQSLFADGKDHYAANFITTTVTAFSTAVNLFLSNVGTKTPFPNSLTMLRIPKRYRLLYFSNALFYWWLLDRLTEPHRFV